MKRIINLLISIRFIPYLLVYISADVEVRQILDYEIERWLVLNRFPKRGIRGFLMLLVAFPEY